MTGRLRRLVARLEAGVQLWPRPSRRRPDPSTDDQLLTSGRGLIDPGGVAAMADELGVKLEPFQRAVLDRWTAGVAPIASSEELAGSMRRMSKAYAHRMAVETALALGEHVHVVLAGTGVSCANGICSPEDLTPPLRGNPTTYFDEAQRMFGASEALITWSPDAAPVVVHGKLLDDTRCCPAAEDPGTLATVFLAGVTCGACAERMRAAHAAAEDAAAEDLEEHRD